MEYNLPMTVLVAISGGVPTVHNAGPLFPAEATQTTPYLLITSCIKSPTRPVLDQWLYSPYDMFITSTYNVANIIWFLQ